MAIVKTVNFYDFERAFVDAGRGDNFSYEGKQILFDYLENLSEEMGEPIELDVIALCCEYSEMTLTEVIKEMGEGVYTIGDDGGDDIIEDVIDDLSADTSVLGHEWTGEEYIVVFQSF